MKRMKKRTSKESFRTDADVERLIAEAVKATGLNKSQIINAGLRQNLPAAVEFVLKERDDAKARTEDHLAKLSALAGNREADRRAAEVARETNRQKLPAAKPSRFPKAA